VSRSKRLMGVANAAPTSFRHRNGGALTPQPELVRAGVFLFLLLDVFPNHPFVATHRGHKVSARIKMLPDEVPPTLPVDPRQMDRAPLLMNPTTCATAYLGGSRSTCARDPSADALRRSGLFLLGQLPEHLAESPRVYRRADVARDAGVMAAGVAVALEHVGESRAKSPPAGDSMVRATVEGGGLSRDVTRRRAGVRSGCADRACGRWRVLHSGGNRGFRWSAFAAPSELTLASAPLRRDRLRLRRLASGEGRRSRPRRSSAKPSEVWLGRRDSNPNNRVQSAVSYR
jgi:hypothetical protein